MVFFGEARSHLHGHDATPAMRVSLYLLAAGTVTSWLVVGPFLHLLESTMPFHKLHAIGLGELAHELVVNPLTYVAMGVVGLGLLAWWRRARLAGVVASFEWLSMAASKSFGFEWINQQVTCSTQSLAGAFRTTQVGHLSWNVVGIIGGLVAVLILLTWGA
jgi:NADH-quinone oxidoreductase subunit L